LRYYQDSLATESRLKSQRLRLTLTIRDGVDLHADTLVRHITVQDHSGNPRHVRLYWAADTVLCETDIGDTAYYDPFGDAVIHYKRHNYLLFSGRSSDGTGLHDFACGMKGVGGMQGTWKDAEDGELSNNPIAQGSVDSAISVAVTVPALGSATAEFWLTAGASRDGVLALSEQVRSETPPNLLTRLVSESNTWREGCLQRIPWREELTKLPTRVQRLFHQSLLIVRTQCDQRGAILAANDTDIMKSNRAHYSYLWARDGALVAHALDSCGCHDIPRAFFGFMERVRPDKRPAFMQKYGPDGSVGASWHSYIAPNGEPEIPIQEDETALVVWALEHHLRVSADPQTEERFYTALIRPCADFLIEFRHPHNHLPLPSWDLWEERRGIHTFTVGTVIAGLRAASAVAERIGDSEGAKRYSHAAEQTLQAMNTYLWSATDHRYARRLEVHADGTMSFDRTLDSSLHALHLFQVLPPNDPRVVSTLKRVYERLRVKAGIGGMARYEGDYYAQVSHDLKNVPGNPWILCTLWQAQWQITTATTLDDLEIATDLLSWAELSALPSGALPEQIHPYNFTPTTVAPLTWSHSEFLATVCCWCKRYQELAASSTHSSPPSK
jgi:GH15 family glucan-1,4-alpha-glucosidase